MSRRVLFRWIGDEILEWYDGAELRRGSAELLRSTSQHRDCILVVPAEQVTLTTLMAPSRKRAAWLKALPYALEDQLAGEIEQVYCIPGSSERDGTTAVAVVAKTTLETWLARCRSANIVPRALLPDALLLNFQKGHWSLLIDGERALVRCARWCAFASEIDTLPILLEQALINASDRPQTMTLWGQLPGAVVPSIERLGVPIEASAARANLLQVLYANVDDCKFDLLRGSSNSAIDSSRWYRPWLTAAGLAALICTVLIIQQGISLWRLKQEAAALQQQTIQVFRQAVPDARRIVNPRAQLQARLNTLQESDAKYEVDFGRLLQIAASVLRQFPRIQLRNLRYRAGQLEIELEGGDLATFDALKARLSEQAEITFDMRARRQDNQVLGQLSLRGKPS